MGIHLVHFANLMIVRQNHMLGSRSMNEVRWFFTVKKFERTQHCQEIYMATTFSAMVDAKNTFLVPNAEDTGH